MICITIQRTLSVAKVQYLIGDKECFKIFYPRFFAWTNLFLLNHILLYSLLFPFQSIQTYVARVPVFWMFCLVCIFSSFRVFCIKASRHRRKTVLWKPILIHNSQTKISIIKLNSIKYLIKTAKTLAFRGCHVVSLYFKPRMIPKNKKETFKPKIKQITQQLKYCLCLQNQQIYMPSGHDRKPTVSRSLLDRFSFGSRWLLVRSSFVSRSSLVG